MPAQPRADTTVKGIRMPVTMAKALDERAEQEGRAPAAIVRELLSDYLGLDAVAMEAMHGVRRETGEAK